MRRIRDASELAAAWASLRRGEWESARAAFATQLEFNPQDPEALDGLGRALWWVGRRQEGIARRREAYTVFRRRGDKLAAANLAIYLAAEHRIAGQPDEASAWLARAERLLEGSERSVERGWLEIEYAKRAAGDPREQVVHAALATETARELGEADLEAAALAQQGLARVDAGEIEPGMILLEEAIAIATGEASDPLAISDACSTTLIACDRLADFPRAADWCRVVVEFTGRRGYTLVNLWCRTIYAGVLTVTGDWDHAERELAWALRGYDALDNGDRAFAIGRLAELRVRQGRLSEARTLLHGYEDDARTGTAAVALAVAQGDHELARALLTLRLEEAGDDSAALASLLPAYVEARIAAGDLETATRAVERLRELGRQLQRANLIVAAQFAAARVAAARGEQADALALFELALGAFGRLQMPLDEGRARLGLARLESGELAQLHARTALAIFERLGARLDVDAATALLHELDVRGRSAPRIEGDLTAREREVLELLGEGLSNQAIAERLSISPRTAEHHVGRILGKLGVQRRAEAAAYALREASRTGPS
jgi:DNA-binding CsgD family transcriptional regulator